MIRKFLFAMSLVTLISWQRTAFAEPSRDTVAAAISVIRELDRPGRITLAAVWDGNKYVQCRLTIDNVVLCEAAGSLMQISLQRVLTPQRVARLTAMGWSLDPSFGNFVKTFAPTATADTIADDALAALEQGYGADMQNLEVETTSVKRQACPPRNGPSQNLAGIINDAPSMAAVAIRACAYRPNGDGQIRKLGPQSTVADLIALYGPLVTSEVRRLRINMHRKVFVVFDAGLGYMQCRPETKPRRNRMRGRVGR